MARPIQTLQACKDCDCFENLYDQGELCKSGYCRFTNSIQPREGRWFCEHFTQEGRRLNPKLEHVYAKRKKGNRKRAA